MKKAVPPKQSLSSFSDEFKSIVLITTLLGISLLIFGLLFVHSQGWITVPFSTLN